MFKVEDVSEQTEFVFDTFSLPGDMQILINQIVSHKVGPTGLHGVSTLQYNFSNSTNLVVDAMCGTEDSTKATIMNVVDPFDVNDEEKFFIKEVCVVLMCLGRSNITYFNTSDEVCSFPFAFYNIETSDVLSCLGEAAIISGLNHAN